MSNPITRLNAARESRYALERELGEGGMARVYLADDLKHERKVAVKVLKPELAAVVGAERFLAEIKTTANLTHPHILPLFDSGEADSFLFYVIPHIEGESLRKRIDREKQPMQNPAFGGARASSRYSDGVFATHGCSLDGAMVDRPVINGGVPDLGRGRHDPIAAGASEAVGLARPLHSAHGRWFSAPSVS